MASSLVIASIADETKPETLSTLATIYENRRDLESALAWYQRYLEKLGTKTKSHLLREARFLGALGREQEALERVEGLDAVDAGGERVAGVVVDLVGHRVELRRELSRSADD